MPELPEVESVRRTLLPQIIKKTIHQAQAANYPRLMKPSPEALAKGIEGRKILAVERLGKLLILKLSGNAFFTIHLGMTGQLIVAKEKPDAGHIHLEACLGKQWLFFRDPRRFGKLAYYASEEGLNTAIAKMGPDALLVQDDEFSARITRRNTPIKPLLLNQAVVCGVGNIYADEALNMCGIAPTRKASAIKPQKLAELNQALKQVMLKSLELGGSSVKNFVDAKGRPGTFQEEHRVYQRAGFACPACGAPVRKMVLGGRTTHFCAKCQK